VHAIRIRGNTINTTPAALCYAAVQMASTDADLASELDALDDR